MLMNRTRWQRVLYSWTAADLPRGFQLIVLMKPYGEKVDRSIASNLKVIFEVEWARGE
jgi:hypothetical protein